MKITQIEITKVPVNHRGNWLFIHVKTDSGISGLGEASQSLNDSLLGTAIDVLRGDLVGTDPFEINRFRQSTKPNRGGRITGTAASAVEQALWDIVGQALNVPIYTLLGGKIRDKIRLYANINRHITDRSPSGFAAAARMAVAEGFTALKIAPFDELRPSDHVRTGANAVYSAGVDRIAAVREAIGNTVELSIDCHSRMDPSEAITVGKLLEPYNLFWYEEPVSCLKPNELRRVAEAVPITTASAESLFGLEGFAPFLENRIVDVLMPDVKHCGGIGELVAISEAAKIHNLLVAPHNPSGPVAMAATAQAVATMDNFLILEYAWGEVSWRHELLDPPELIQDGYLVVSDRPGLGHKLKQ